MIESCHGQLYFDLLLNQIVGVLLFMNTLFINNTFLNVEGHQNQYEWEVDLQPFQGIKQKIPNSCQGLLSFKGPAR